MSSERIVVWWGIPCKSAIPVFRSLKEEHGRDVVFVALRQLPPHRRRLGWSVPEGGDMPLHVLGDEDWRGEVDRLLEEGAALHLVNGVYHDERVAYVAKRLARDEHRFGVVMEAPSNLEAGVKRKIKSALAPIVTPLRAGPVARKADFVLSASGDRAPDFRRLGFKAEGIYPFGYFPDFPRLERQGSEDGRLRILCTGYLEPFKGQDCLLRALAILKSKGVAFECAITGYGSAAEDLAALTEALDLKDEVAFTGVVDEARLAELFRTSNVFAAPGREEPWGIRVNEALLSGLAVVVSDGVGAQALVASSGAGEVFESGSETALADALVRLARRLAEEPGFKERLLEFRARITPSAAAGYLDAVLVHADGLPSAQRPVPPWAA